MSFLLSTATYSTHLRTKKADCSAFFLIFALTNIISDIKHRKKMDKTDKEPSLFSNIQQRKRYLSALIMIVLMIGVAELLNEKEIIFPEMAALAIGMWIVNKRVWRVRYWQMLLLMTLGACAGVLIVLYSPFSLIINIAIAFTCAAIGLLVTRASLFPLISACVLPVLLKTESWVYPLSVFVMTLIIIAGQRWMVYRGIREPIVYEPAERNWSADSLRWVSLLMSVAAVACLAVYTSNFYFIIPPLIVMYVEFVNSKAGFRNRPVLTILLLVSGSLVGTVFQWFGYHYLGLPETVVALFIFIVLFTLFEWLGKFFAPVGAMALIPMLLPKEALFGLPFQVLIGATLFIAMGMIFFQQCYRWSRAQLVYCLIPHYLLSRLRRNREGYL